MVSRVILTDNVTIEVNESTSELLCAFTFSGGGGIQGGQIFRFALEGKQAFACGNDNEFLDPILANLSDSRRASPTSAELLTSGD